MLLRVLPYLALLGAISGCTSGGGGGGHDCQVQCGLSCCGDGQTCVSGACSAQCAVHCGSGCCGDGESCVAGSCQSAASGSVSFGEIRLGTVDGGKFPTYLAHLYGQQIGATAIHAVMSAALINTGAAAAHVTLTAQLQGYSQPASQSFEVGAGSTISPSVDLTFDFGALYSVSAAVSANFAFTLTDQTGEMLQSKTIPVTVLPKNTVFWTLPDANGQQQDASDFIAVFSTPHDSTHSIDSLLTEAAHQSAFKAILGYEYRGRTLNDGASVSPGTCAYRTAYYEQGQPVSVSASVTCNACLDSNAEYYVLDDANFNLAQQNQNFKYLIGSQALGSFQQNFDVPANGTYHHVMCNPQTNNVSRNFTVARTIGDNEGAIDQMGAIFLALKNRGMVYVNVPQDFFDNAQNVKFPPESLSTDSANCIDGTLVFASALESIQMEPAVIKVPGHAFVAVRLAPGIDQWMPIETTMVSSGTVMDAVTTSSNEWKQNQQMNVLQIIDIAKMRSLGIKPAPI